MANLLQDWKFWQVKPPRLEGLGTGPLPAKPRDIVGLGFGVNPQPRLQRSLPNTQLRRELAIGNNEQPGQRKPVAWANGKTTFYGENPPQGEGWQPVYQNELAKREKASTRQAPEPPEWLTKISDPLIAASSSPAGQIIGNVGTLGLGIMSGRLPQYPMVTETGLVGAPMSLMEQRAMNAVATGAGKAASVVKPVLKEFATSEVGGIGKKANKPIAQASGQIPPNSPLGTIEGMWAKGRKPTAKNTADAYLKAQEWGNDIYYGIRLMQSRVAKNLPIESGGPNDVTTLLTRAPGAANAGATRYILTVDEIKKLAPKTTADDINTILYANHAKEVLAQKGANRVMAGNFKDATELDNALTQLQVKLGSQGFNEAQKGAEVVKSVYASERQRLVDEGFITKELGEELAQKYPWYNPLHYLDTAEEMAAQGKNVKPFSVISSGLKRLSEQGTAKEAIAPLNLLGDQLIKNEVRIVKNQTAKAIVTLAKEDPTLNVKRISGMRQVANVGGQGVFRPTTQDVPGTLSFFENGKRQIYQVPDFIYRESNVLNQTISNPAASLVGALNGVSRAAFTTFSPPFVVSNVLNDMLTAFISRGIMPQQTGARLINSIKGLENDQLMQAFRLAGGYQQRFYGRDAQALAKQVGVTGGTVIKDNTSFIKKVWEAIPKAGEAGEQAPRTALFRRELDNNLPGWQKMTAEQIAATPQGKKAAADAVELTINFGRGAYLVKSANPFVIFLNANMEGAKLPFRVLRSNAAARWRLAGVAATAAGVAAYNLSYPEYMDIPNNIRWGSSVIMLPSKEKNTDGTNKPNYITVIPKTREWGTFLGSMTYSMERMYAEAPADFGTFTATMTPMLAPLSEVPGPALLQEISGQLANWDFYQARPIVSQSLQNLPANEQVLPSTSRTVQLGANALGVSPVRAQHFLTGIFGGAGQTITSMTDLVANLLKPQETDAYIVNLANEYQSWPKTQQKAFLDRMPTSSKRALLNYIEKPEAGIPVITPVVKRVYPGYGGQLTSNEYDKVAGNFGQIPLSAKEVSDYKDFVNQTLKEGTAAYMASAEYQMTPPLNREERLASKLSELQGKAREDFIKQGELTQANPKDSAATKQARQDLSKVRDYLIATEGITDDRARTTIGNMLRYSDPDLDVAMILNNFADKPKTEVATALLQKRKQGLIASMGTNFASQDVNRIRKLVEPYYDVERYVWSLYPPSNKVLADQIKKLENGSPLEQRQAKAILRQNPSILRARELIANYKLRMRRSSRELDYYLKTFGS